MSADLMNFFKNSVWFSGRNLEILEGSYEMLSQGL